MTRLSEALERAHIVPPREAEPVSTGGDQAPQTPEAAARVWRFETDGLDGDLVRQAEPVGQRGPGGPEEPGTEDEYAGTARPAVQAPEYRFSESAADKVVVGLRAEPALVEQYRRLGAVLHHAQLQNGDRSVMIASAVAAEGKTLTATNLALTLSHSYERRVLLIDADLRRPSVHDVFQLSNRGGLSNSLRHPEGGRLPVQHVMPRLWILPAGRPDPDPMSSLVSDTMKQLLIDAVDQFDWVIVDTPPVALMPDANLLAGMIDCALLVVSASSTPFPLVKRATESIGASRILGVVFNRAEKSALADGYGSYGYYYKHYGAAQEPRRRVGFGLFGTKRA